MSLSLSVSEIIRKSSNPLVSKAKQWERVNLSEICFVLNGFAFKSTYFNTETCGLPLIRIRDVKESTISTYFSGEYLSEYIISKDDILIGMDGDFNCKKWQNIPSLLNQRVCKIEIFNKNYNKSFLYYSLPAYLNEINVWTSAVTVKHLSSNSIKEIPLPLPPLNEQKRIVAKLDRIMPRIDSVKARLDRVPTIIKRFRQSVLTAAVTGKLTEKWREEHPNVESAKVLLERIRQNREYIYKKQCEVAKKKGDRKPKKPENLCPIPIGDDNDGNPLSWVYATFRDISSTEHYAMTSGPFGSALGTKDYQVTGTPVIRGQNIQPGRFNDSGFVYISEAKSKELNRSKAQPGDIVIVAVGAGVGNSAILPETIKSAILSQNCNKFKVDCQVVLNSYILSALQISIIRTQMDESTTDTARQFLSLTNLKGMVFPLPPLEEQQEIVRQVDKLFALADKLESHYQKAKTHVDKLSPSVLAKAFRGELVPQDPNDEPAEKLLERIIAEKAKMEGGKKKAGGRKKETK